VEFWDVDQIDTLDSYQGKVRVIRASITQADPEPTTWCFAVVGPPARKVTRRTALKVTRARWHIEDTGFQQWIRYWNFGHVFRHTANAPDGVFYCSGRWPSICFNSLFIDVRARNSDSQAARPTAQLCLRLPSTQRS
jgi:hypothetical protein